MGIKTCLIAAMAAWAMGASAYPSSSHQERDVIGDLVTEITELLESESQFGAPPNNFSCTSTHNPVVLMHGLGSDNNTDLQVFAKELVGRGYCTFTITYGANPVAPVIGGLTDMQQSAKQLADFIFEVQDQTGASKIDLIGHSEGAVQSLFVPLTQSGIAPIVEHIVALAPSVHGAPYYGLSDLAYIGGNTTRELIGDLIDLIGCPACEQLAPGGSTINTFNAATGHIAQAGNKVTIISSSSDTLVPTNDTIVDEPTVNNVLVQTSCPDDTVGHGSLVYDPSVWNLILQALEESDDEFYPCAIWPPI
ncbi:Alpha/Beta hydrolase protein [Xylariaceae sp. FL0255]|nr:Alpha/Beta hydrolase protein [Xylariaceae sp. FL0255]